MTTRPAVMPCYLGVTVDHLYQDCPALVRAVQGWHGQYGQPPPGTRTVGHVDPEGTDICRQCYRRWKATR